MALVIAPIMEIMEQITITTDVSYSESEFNACLASLPPGFGSSVAKRAARCRSECSLRRALYVRSRRVSSSECGRAFMIAHECLVCHCCPGAPLGSHDCDLNIAADDRF